MSTHASAKAPLRHRLAEELTTLFALTLYLYICFGAVLLLKTSILRDAGISNTAWGVAVIKAVVLAKFMMIGRAIARQTLPAPPVDLADVAPGSPVPGAITRPDHHRGDRCRSDPQQAAQRLPPARRWPDLL